MIKMFTGDLCIPQHYVKYLEYLQGVGAQSGELLRALVSSDRTLQILLHCRLLKE